MSPDPIRQIIKKHFRRRFALLIQPRSPSFITCSYMIVHMQNAQPNIIHSHSISRSSGLPLQERALTSLNYALNNNHCAFAITVEITDSLDRVLRTSASLKSPVP